MPRTPTTAALAALLALALAPRLHAQPAQVQPPARTPVTVAVTGGVGLIGVPNIAGANGAGLYAFDDDAFQLRLSAERLFRRDLAAGVAGTFTRLEYAVSGGTCAGCAGTGQLWQGLAFARLGGGGGRIGFHSVLEGALGVSAFTSFRRGLDPSSVPGTPPPPVDGAAFTAAVTYGGGYTITPQLEVDLVQDLGFMFRTDDDDSSTGGSSTPRYGVTRLSFRYTFGSTRR